MEPRDASDIDGQTERSKLAGANESIGKRASFQIEAIGPKYSRPANRHRSVLIMKSENPTIEICPGITRRTVAHGKTMYQMLATLAAGSVMPAHSHSQEQIVHILEGKMRLIVEGVPHELSMGDSFYLASNVPHGVETLQATRVPIRSVRPATSIWQSTEKCSTERCNLYQTENRPVILSARPRSAAQLSLAYDESRLVVAPLRHQSAEGLPSLLV